MPTGIFLSIKNLALGIPSFIQKIVVNGTLVPIQSKWSKTVENKSERRLHNNVLFFKTLRLSISEWCPFGQDTMLTFNDSINGLKVNY
ncbi:MAG: hypothetical protein KAR64_01540 [Thermoplasmatales archaeon]|nr:hypothetical protein [Thermoplasmatales archaeon]